MIDESCSTDRFGIKVVFFMVLALGGPVASGQQLRVFMARDGEQAIQPVSGNTNINMLPGETATIAVFLEDTTPGPDLLNAYLIVLHYDAAALPCSAGDVTYVDENPGQPGGASIFLDTQRPDWVFAGSSLLPVIYNETPGGGYFGVFYATIPNTFVDLSGLGIRYLVQFGITASGGACGQFEFPFRLSPEPPPLSSLRNPIGAFLPVNEWQTLIISLPACCDDGNPCTTEICDPVGGCANILQCTSDSECTDADGCTIDLCATDGCCVYEPLDCDDSDPCTSDGCLPLSGCINEPIDCDDGDACLAHECNPATGLCEPLPINSGQTCDDGDDCTIDDVCTPQGACAGQPLSNCAPLPAVSGTGMAALCVLLAIGLTIRRPDR